MVMVLNSANSIRFNNAETYSIRFDRTRVWPKLGSMTINWNFEVGCGGNPEEYLEVHTPDQFIRQDNSPTIVRIESNTDWSCL